MVAIQPRIVATGVLFVLIFGSGVWLTSAGKPFNWALLTVHKLASLATVALIALTVRQLHTQAKLSAAEIGAAVITALLFVLTVATGGILSTTKPAHPAVLAAHRVAPFLTVLSTVVTVYLMIRGRL